MTATWVGLTSKVLGHRDGRVLRAPGLFAFVRSDPRDGPLLLFAGEAEDLQAAGPGHTKRSAALSLGLDELHVSFPISRRIDRLQPLARILAREQALLDLVDEQVPPAVRWPPARSVC